MHLNFKFSLVLLLIPVSGEPCSVFRYDAQGAAYVAKSFDLETPVEPFAVREPAGLARKTAGGFSWVSKYGGVTIRLRGTTSELPGCGMNERGLVCEAPVLAGTPYSQPGEGPELNELEFLQYQLDNFSTVQEIAANASKFRIRRQFTPLHYMCCDKASCVSIQPQKRGISVTPMPVPALTNVLYASASAELGGYEGFGGSKPVPSGFGTFQRFVRAASYTRYDSAFPPLDFGLRGLDSLYIDGATRWQALYDMNSRKVYLRRAKGGHLDVFDADN